MNWYDICSRNYSFFPLKDQKHGQKELPTNDSLEACTLLNQESLFVELPQHMRETWKHSKMSHVSTKLQWPSLANFSEACVFKTFSSANDSLYISLCFKHTTLEDFKVHDRFVFKLLSLYLQLASKGDKILNFISTVKHTGGIWASYSGTQIRVHCKHLMCFQSM